MAGRTDSGSAEPQPPNTDAGTKETGTAIATGSCGTGQRNSEAFGCAFAWGTNDLGTELTNWKELGFISKWIGWEVEKSGAVPRCEGCTWLKTQIAGTSTIPVYYGYFIGYFGSVNGFPDQNQQPSGPNLATDGAQLIRDHRSQIIDMYAYYAKETANAWPTKPLVWLLEGDFIQYAYQGKDQKNALSYKELGELARDITCAIKGNMPNAVVAINHITWNSDEETNNYWAAMEAVDYDLVWTTGVANNKGFIEAGGQPSSYNASTAKYEYIAHKTGRKILVDTSFGLSGMPDTWSSAAPTTLNERIAEGVVAANVAKAPKTFVSTVRELGGKLQAVCE
ncbi:MAG: hypothetical protein RLZZ450_1508 [Pseudomonadota bacterium]|jgi:hypothetical protein